MNVFALDQDLNILCEVDLFTYLAITKNYRSPSSFVIKINRYAYGAEALQVGNYLWIRDEQLSFVGRIEAEEIELNEEGRKSEVWTKKGHDFSGILLHRLCLHNITSGSGYDEVTGKAETVMKHYVDVNVVNPSNTARAIPLLSIAPDQERGETITYQARLQTVAEVIENIARATGLGWSIEFDEDTKSFVFDVLEGSNRQEVKLSPEFGNLRRLNYVYDTMNSKNLVIVGDAGEGAARIFLTYPSEEPTGLDRREVFADARDLDSTQLEVRAKETLEELGNVQILNAEHLIGGTFIFGRDFSLGDIITVVYPGIAEVSSRVLSATFEYTPSGKTVTVSVKVGTDSDVAGILRYQRKTWLNEARR